MEFMPGENIESLKYSNISSTYKKIKHKLYLVIIFNINFLL